MPTKRDEVPAAPVRVAPAPPDARPPWRRFFFTKRFLFVSVTLHLLLAAGAGVWIVQVASVGRPAQVFTAAPQGPPTVATRALEHQVKLAKKQGTMSAPPALKRVTTTGAAKVALPSIPALPRSQATTPLAMAGMGVTAAPGFGFGNGLGGGGSTGGGGPVTNFIGGMRVTAGKLGVALDTSGSVRDYQQEMHEYIGKVFKGSQIIEFSAAGFFTVQHSRGSMGSAVLEFLKSPQKFDAIYIFSDFGETREGLREGSQDLWGEVQKLVREKKVKLYLHVLREPGREGNINAVLNGVIQFAKGTGGGVKIGAVAHLSDGNTGKTPNGSSRL